MKFINNIQYLVKKTTNLFNDAVYYTTGPKMSVEEQQAKFQENILLGDITAVISFLESTKESLNVRPKIVYFDRNIFLYNNAKDYILIITSLLENGYNVKDITLRLIDDKGNLIYCPLIFGAIKASNSEQVKYLIEKGDNLNFKLNNYGTLINIACQARNGESLRCLINSYPPSYALIELLYDNAFNSNLIKDNLIEELLVNGTKIPITLQEKLPVNKLKTLNDNWYKLASCLYMDIILTESTIISFEDQPDYIFPDIAFKRIASKYNSIEDGLPKLDLTKLYKLNDAAIEDLTTRFNAMIESIKSKYNQEPQEQKHFTNKELEKKNQPSVMTIM